jgi:hypothetical protein
MVLARIVFNPLRVGVDWANMCGTLSLWISPSRVISPSTSDFSVKMLPPHIGRYNLAANSNAIESPEKVR